MGKCSSTQVDFCTPQPAAYKLPVALQLYNVTITAVDSVAECHPFSQDLMDLMCLVCRKLIISLLIIWCFQRIFLSALYPVSILIADKVSASLGGPHAYGTWISFNCNLVTGNT